jgi:RNA polymerase sigma-70 factor (ECF subfamily)
VIVSTQSDGGTGPDGGLSAAEDFGVFYRREFAPVVRLAYVLTGRIDLAEEAAQDAFLAAYQRWDRIAAYDDPGAWVRRVATNRCISGFRKRRSELRALLRLSRRPAPPDEIAESDSELWAAVRSLPPRQAQVLALIFVEDRSIANVAGLIGCGEETARTHARRGRLSLARKLQITGQENDQ